MHRLPLLVLPLLFAGLVLAQEKPAPLTSKETAEGWLQLFDGETSFGWHIDGEVKVEKGSLVLGGKETKAVFETGFGEFDLSADVTGNGHVLVRLGTEESKAALGSDRPMTLTL